MSVLTWESEFVTPRSPILVAAFEGPFDVGGAATGAVQALQSGPSELLAEIDPDPFFDFSVHRPTVRLNSDGQREVSWPENRVYALPTTGSGRDLVLIDGVEPHLMWRTFSEAIAEVAARLDVAMVITLGAMIAETPHTRPPSITGSTTDAKLAALLGLERPSYQGPTGVVGVLHERLERDGIPAVSLRASVPHYVSGMPNPKASRALLERFERVAGVPTAWAALDQVAHEWEARVDKAMVDDEEIISYVRRLEECYDERTKSTIPNAEDLAAEFELFLRRHNETEQ